MKPYYDEAGITIYHGDCREVVPTLGRFDLCLTDPPYGLRFMGKAWDYDVPDVDLWRVMFEALKPGAHLLAFAGTRTQHRMAVNIEDAGFEIRDMIAWIYGSGFPKSHDVSKAIDKAAGAEREVIGTKLGRPGMAKDGSNQRSGFDDAFGGEQSGPMSTDITAPATDAAKQWSGWGTALKPAMEPITVARKPLSEGTVAANVLAHGTGGLNIDGCRVGTDDDLSGRTYGGVFGASRNPDGTLPKAIGSGSKGRWPANLIHDGSDEVVGLFPKSGPAKAGNRGAGLRGHGRYGKSDQSFENVSTICDNGGSAARFFYCAKASKAERNKGCEGLVTNGTQGNRPGSPDFTGKFPDHDHRERGGNNHPTVKPVKLMQYLITLGLPPGGVLLDPFGGSGTTGLAAKYLGCRAVLIEREERYCEIAAQRLRHFYGPLWPGGK